MDSVTAQVAALVAVTDQLLFVIQRRSLLSHGEIDDVLKGAVESISGDSNTSTAARHRVEQLWSALVADRE